MIAIAIVATGLAGCGKKQDAASCPPLEVTVDGKPVAFTTFLGVEQNGVGYLVQGFNHDKTTCAEMLQGTRSIPEGEQYVSAWIPRRGSPATNVGHGFHTQFGVKTSLAVKPAKDGDRVAICVPEKVSFTPKQGPSEGKAVTIHGLLDGRFCGPSK